MKGARPLPLAAQAFRPKGHCPLGQLNIQIFYIQRIFLNKLPARLGGVAHQFGEDFIGFANMLLQQGTERFTITLLNEAGNSPGGQLSRGSSQRQVLASNSVLWSVARH